MTRFFKLRLVKGFNAIVIVRSNFLDLNNKRFLKEFSHNVESKFKVRLA